jgi:polysaccharide deacetylase family protein (PEP-CTERM system associated)
MSRVVNALSVDVEDYFMVSAFETRVPKAQWPAYESRVVQNTEKLLALFDEFQARATFFVLGWVGEKYPDLVRTIASRGHEVACHGYFHRLIYDQTPEEFRQDVRRAKEALERACGRPVIGYRAPSFSIVESTPWAWDILREVGFQYDASLLPAAHARGGLPGAPRVPFRKNGLGEFPMSTMEIAGLRFPFSGGGYFRLMPYALVRWGIQRLNRQGIPAVVYLHPWEFDPDQPRLKGKAVDTFKHYVNIRRAEKKLRRLLSDFSFRPVHDVLNAALAPAANSANVPEVPSLKTLYNG